MNQQAGKVGASDEESQLSEVEEDKNNKVRISFLLASSPPSV
jgi:hypothetical protein